MKVLVVVDMQNDFVTGVLGTEEAKAIVPNVVRKIEGYDGDIAVTMDTHFSDYLETQEGKKLPVPHCIHLEHGWELVNDVFDAVDGKFTPEHPTNTFTKFTFGSTGLAQWLCVMEAKHGLEEVEFIGLCTDICVISNVMLAKAYIPDVRIVVDASCCAGVTPESHKTALAAMKSCQVEVINE